jgi:hypothetical protein
MRYVLATDGSPMSRRAGFGAALHLGHGSSDELFLIYVSPVLDDPQLREIIGGPASTIGTTVVTTEE